MACSLFGSTLAASTTAAPAGCGLMRLGTAGCMSPRLPVTGKEANRASDAATLAAFSETQSTIQELVVEGDTVVSHWTWQAVHTGTSPAIGIPPTGKHIQLSGCSIYHFQDDKIVEQWEYGDMLGMLQQLGVVPALG